MRGQAAGKVGTRVFDPARFDQEIQDIGDIGDVRRLIAGRRQLPAEWVTASRTALSFPSEVPARPFGINVDLRVGATDGGRLCSSAAVR